MSTRQVKSRLSIRLAAQEPRVKAIYVGTYIPRECGIATFTKDLTNAVNLLNPTYLADIIAIDDIAVASESEPKRSYPWEVKFKINQEDLASWLAAADYINQSSAQIVNLQHEFGIYGGQRGEYVLPFMERIRKPIVITLHTVMPDPDIVLQEMVGRMAKLASAVVVMVETAAHRLVEKYQIDPEKIVVIPHGVPDVPLIDPDSRKKRFRLFGQNVITSFGLLNRGKGYEYLIKALPQVLERHPNTKLMLIGETHPVIFRQEGESYRRELEELVDDLKLSRQVTFINKYLALDQLINYLVASDIYVTPYLNLHQITSGTLAYAIGAGRACVSTPYLYAQEVFNEGRGLLIEPRDANELAEKIIYLLDKPKIRREMMQRAYAFGRGMIWSRVGLKYLELFRLVADRDDV